MEHCSRQIRANQAVTSIVSLAQRQLTASAEAVSAAPGDFLSQDILWKRIMGHFRSQRSNFSLENIEFCPEKLFGLAKYPINIWNQLELTNNDLKYNLNT